MKLKLSATNVEPLTSIPAGVDLKVIGDLFKAQEDSRRVQITSPTIETSYFKSTNRTLPAARYRGGVQPAADDPGPFGISHLREDDGSIDTDSVVEWGAPSSLSYWIGRGVFNANTVGFTNPTYKWSKEGDGGLTSQAQNLSTSSSWDLTGAMGRLRFGSTPDMSSGAPQPQADVDTFDKNSTIIVDVIDGPNTDGAKATNKFNVSWHLPSEGKRALPLPPNQPLYDHQFTYQGGIGQVGAGQTFTQTTFRYSPAYIQFINDYLNNTTSGIGEIASIWLSGGVKNALVVAKVFAGKNLTEETAAINQNLQENFQESQALDAAGIVPAGLRPPMVPAFKVHGDCYLVAPIHYRRYKTEFWEHDAYDAKGYEGLDVSKSNTKEYDHMAGLYEPITGPARTMP